MGTSPCPPPWLSGQLCPVLPPSRAQCSCPGSHSSKETRTGSAPVTKAVPTSWQCWHSQVLFPTNNPDTKGHKDQNWPEPPLPQLWPGRRASTATSAHLCLLHLIQSSACSSPGHRESGWEEDTHFLSFPLAGLGVNPQSRDCRSDPPSPGTPSTAWTGGCNPLLSSSDRGGSPAVTQQKEALCSQVY